MFSTILLPTVKSCLVSTHVGEVKKKLCVMCNVLRMHKRWACFDLQSRCFAKPSNSHRHMQTRVSRCCFRISSCEVNQGWIRRVTHRTKKSLSEWILYCMHQLRTRTFPPASDTQGLAVDRCTSVMWSGKAYSNIANPYIVDRVQPLRGRVA